LTRLSPPLPPNAVPIVFAALLFGDPSCQENALTLSSCFDEDQTDEIQAFIHQFLSKLFTKWADAPNYPLLMLVLKKIPNLISQNYYPCLIQILRDVLVEGTPHGKIVSSLLSILCYITPLSVNLLIFHFNHTTLILTRSMFYSIICYTET
jgi:hypothetical protein